MARSHMNMPIICARSFCGGNEVPDFTNCKRVPGRAYNGANGKKIAIEYQGERYMLKYAEISSFRSGKENRAVLHE